MRTLSLLLLCLFSTAAFAGRGCETRDITPSALASAADTALSVRAELDARDAPVALIARHGTDLSQYGLHYSHIGIAVRDHPEGRWTVIHLLNSCGTDRSALYVQGLVNFFADDLISQDWRIDWLQPELGGRLLQLIESDAGRRLHDPDYNIIARHDSTRGQNSTSWVLEVLAAARVREGIAVDRKSAQAMAAIEGHTPDVLRIRYGKRILGGLFAANADFTDHPVSARLAGRYPVVTVHSILRWLERIGAIEHTREQRA